ncbi:Pr6Pr family membrane protein [Actinoplanes sp. NPDC048967]|uniref:Pr6Pr family membrane protein n=1 Tax=Actinoplanes sp. NPDC048967 TaxID=3155269 RepID=UPI00340172EA
MKIMRLIAVAAVIAGVVLTAAGPATVTGLLPFFTIQSNVAYGVFAAWAAFRGRDTPAALKGAVTLYVAITGLVYHLVLTNPASGFAVDPVHRDLPEAIGNQLLHTVVPLLAVLDWLVFDERGRFRWRHALYWLAFPLGYLAFALIRGLVVDKYPYPFIDVNELGYDGVSISSAGFAVAFWILGLLFVAIDRWSGRLLRRHRAAAPTTTT